MLIGVTGGTGYLGAHSVRAPLAEGHHVRLLVAPDAHGAPVLRHLAAAGDVDLQAGSSNEFLSARASFAG